MKSMSVYVVLIREGRDKRECGSRGFGVSSSEADADEVLKKPKCQIRTLMDQGRCADFSPPCSAQTFTREHRHSLRHKENACNQ